jgi:hypothetical protein
MEIIFEGKKFIQGLHGVPEYYSKKNALNNPQDWWWEKGSNKEDNKFLHKTAVDEIKRKLTFRN